MLSDGGRRIVDKLRDSRLSLLSARTISWPWRFPQARMSEIRPTTVAHDADDPHCNRGIHWLPLSWRVTVAMHLRPTILTTDERGHPLRYFQKRARPRHHFPPRSELACALPRSSA
jgi:hypothetical protein